MKREIIFILLSTLFMAANTANAQEGEEKYDEEITVVAPYQPTISDAYKINISPKMVDYDIESPDLSYSISSKQIPTTVRLDPILPAKIKGEPLDKLYRNLIKAGFGTYTTPYFELFASKLRSKKASYGLHFRHLSSSGDIEDYAFPGFSDNLAEVYGHRYFRNHTLSARASYKRDVVHFYGYKPQHFDYNLDKEDLKQRFNTFAADFKFSSNYTRGSSLNHKFGLSYYYFNDLFDVQEHYIGFGSNINKEISLLSAGGEEKIGAEVLADIYLNQDSVVETNNGVISVRPFLQTGGDIYRLKVGVNASILADTTGELNFYPMAQAEIDLIPSYLTVYAGVSGEVERNNYYDLTGQNPFLTSFIPISFSEQKYSITGGIKGNVGNRADFNFFVNTSEINAMPFFVTDTSTKQNRDLLNQFTIVYDDITQLHAGAALDYHHNDKLRMTMQVDFYRFDLENEMEPWHRPNLELNYGINYNIANKIIASGNIFAASSRNARTYKDGEIIISELDGFIDGNIGLEYRFTKLLSAFVNFNNIGSVRYYEYYRYPSYRFNVLGGVSYSF